LSDKKPPPGVDAASHEQTDAGAADGLEAGALLPPEDGIDCVVPPPPGIDPATWVAAFACVGAAKTIWLWLPDIDLSVAHADLRTAETHPDPCAK